MEIFRFRWKLEKNNSFCVLSPIQQTASAFDHVGKLMLSN